MKIEKEKILLVCLPFWTPLIPPMGIACLKSFLEKYGYQVKTVDANIEKDFSKSYSEYFDALKDSVPLDKRGNFYNIGHDVLRYHMMSWPYYTC